MPTDYYGFPPPDRLQGSLALAHDELSKILEIAACASQGMTRNETCRGFPNLGGTVLRVSILRIIVFVGLHWVFKGN